MLAIFFIIIGTVARLLPHPPNMAPIAAMALFGGVYLDRRIAIVVPVIAMFVGDFFLGFHKLMPYVYGSFLLISLLGLWLKKHKYPSFIVGTSLLGSLLFFLVTNFGVWAQTSMYSKTLAGLLESYIMALPFFRNTLIGDLFYTTVFFGGYEMVKLKVTVPAGRQESETPKQNPAREQVPYRAGKFATGYELKVSKESN